ncbi:MAG: ribonuclease P protein component [Acidimicrobiales bacterium]
MAPPVGRIHERTTFQALRSSRSRVRRGPITITWVGGRGDPAARVAYAVGRKVGGAVVRNRVRRRLRAICAELGPSLPPGAYLIRASAEVSRLSYGELRTLVHQALEGLSRKQAEEPGR